MASRIPLPMMGIFFVLAIFIIITYTPHPHSGQTSGISVDPNFEFLLKNNAQNALHAIGSNRTPSASYNRAKQGQHVFNKGLLKFHRKVLKDLLTDRGDYHEQMKNLEQYLMIPLSQSIKNNIRTMVATFRPREFYVDFNAGLFGVYVKELREALVAYLKADTSVDKNGRYGIQRIRRRVQLIADQMVNHTVYVDPMARDRWLGKKQNKREVYNAIKCALKEFFQNPLHAFEKVSEKIRGFRMTTPKTKSDELK